MLCAGEAGLGLAATSTSLALRLCAPIASGFAVVIDQPPPAATVAVPIAVVPSKRVTVSPASPLPATVTVSPDAPLSAATAKLSPEGAGAEILIVSFSAAEAALAPLVALVSVAVRVCTPAARALVGVTDQAPPAATVAVPIAFARRTTSPYPRPRPCR